MWQPSHTCTRASPAAASAAWLLLSAARFADNTVSETFLVHSFQKGASIRSCSSSAGPPSEIVATAPVSSATASFDQPPVLFGQFVGVAARPDGVCCRIHRVHHESMHGDMNGHFIGNCLRRTLCRCGTRNCSGKKQYRSKHLGETTGSISHTVFLRGAG